MLALLIGLAVSAIVRVDGKSFITGDIIAQAPAVTFLWVKRFPLGESKQAAAAKLLANTDLRRALPTPQAFTRQPCCRSSSCLLSRPWRPWGT